MWLYSTYRFLFWVGFALDLPWLTTTCFLNNSDGLPAGCSDIRVHFFLCLGNLFHLPCASVDASPHSLLWLRMKHTAIKEICSFHWRFFWLISDPHKLSVSPSMKDINPRGFELCSYRIVFRKPPCFISHQLIRPPARKNHYTICSLVQSHKQRAKPQQFGSE